MAFCSQKMDCSRLSKICVSLLLVATFLHAEAERDYVTSSSRVACKDEYGSQVDWFIVLKFPNAKGYAYVDSNSVGGGLRPSSFSLGSQTDGAVAETLSRVYEQDDNSVGYVFYNDEDPQEHKHWTGGHSKGALGFDSKGGFWLLHSVPRFPSVVADGYDGLPDNEIRYGQSMICMSLGLSDLENSAGQILIGEAWPYDHNMPTNLENSLPSLMALMNRQRVSQDSSMMSIRAGSTTFTTFFKSSGWGDFLYESFVQPYFSVDMRWETWMNGINPDDSFCKPKYQYDSINVRTVKLAGQEWKETQDHSKWGVAAEDSSTPVVCIGDINRQQSQNHRGGGTVCIVDRDLWQAFSSTVESQDSCN